jgi:RNA polymerase sigma factor (TIGR02999 family)
MTEESANVTQLLKAWSGGNQEALAELTPKVYLELRRMAAGYMRREAAGNTLPATALVHEVFLRLVEVNSVTWQDRAHFFAVSANMMRRILVDRARAKGMGKRGGAALHVNLDDVPEIALGSRSREIVAVDEALDTLAQIDPRKAKVIELRFFGGLSVEETAEVLKISPQSVMRDWKMARAWLLTELAQGAR